MSDLLDDVRKSPVLARTVPFVVFLVLTYLQDGFGEAGRYWLYLVKTLVGAWMLWEVRHVIPEMRWNLSGEAVVVGVLVCVMWIGIDPFYPKQDTLWYLINGGDNPAEKPVKFWNPFTQFGDGALLAWFFVVVRLVGSTCVVPPLEEVFYRSFLYRFLISPEFERVPLHFRHATALGLSALVFAFTHHQWLAGILCGVIYQLLVFRKKRLGDAITAHAVTNFLLGVWVVVRGDWIFW